MLSVERLIIKSEASFDTKKIDKYIRSVILKMSNTNVVKRIESELEVQTFLAKLRYAIKSDSVSLNIQKDRKVDINRDVKHTNRYTISMLFPDEDEVDCFKRELYSLALEEYMETVKDTKFPKKSDMRVFGRPYLGQDVYIKIRVELLSNEHANGNNYIFVMSFHFSERIFKETDFPYKRC